MKTKYQKTLPLGLMLWMALIGDIQGQETMTDSQKALWIGRGVLSYKGTVQWKDRLELAQGGQQSATGDGNRGCYEIPMSADFGGNKYNSKFELMSFASLFYLPGKEGSWGHWTVDNKLFLDDPRKVKLCIDSAGLGDNCGSDNGFKGKFGAENLYYQVFATQSQEVNNCLPAGASIGIGAICCPFTKTDTKKNWCVVEQTETQKSVVAGVEVCKTIDNASFKEAESILTGYRNVITKEMPKVLDLPYSKVMLRHYIEVSAKMQEDAANKLKADVKTLEAVLENLKIFWKDRGYTDPAKVESKLAEIKPTLDKLAAISEDSKSATYNLYWSNNQSLTVTAPSLVTFDKNILDPQGDGAYKIAGLFKKLEFDYYAKLLKYYYEYDYILEEALEAANNEQWRCYYSTIEAPCGIRYLRLTGPSEMGADETKAMYLDFVPAAPELAPGANNFLVDLNGDAPYFRSVTTTSFEAYLNSLAANTSFTVYEGLRPLYFALDKNGKEVLMNPLSEKQQGLDVKDFSIDLLKGYSKQNQDGRLFDRVFYIEKILKAHRVFTNQLAFLATSVNCDSGKGGNAAPDLAGIKAQGATNSGVALKDGASNIGSKEAARIDVSVKNTDYSGNLNTALGANLAMSKFDPFGLKNFTDKTKNMGGHGNFANKGQLKSAASSSLTGRRAQINKKDYSGKNTTEKTKNGLAVTNAWKNATATINRVGSNTASSGHAANGPAVANHNAANSANRHGANSGTEGASDSNKKVDENSAITFGTSGGGSSYYGGSGNRGAASGGNRFNGAHDNGNKNNGRNPMIDEVGRYKEDYKPKEDDTLWRIVTKAYMRSLRKVLE